MLRLTAAVLACYWATVTAVPLSGEGRTTGRGIWEMTRSRSRTSMPMEDLMLWWRMDACSVYSSLGVPLGNGDGTPQTVSVPTWEGWPHPPWWSLVNGDGKPDIVVANSCASNCAGEGSVASVAGKRPEPSCRAVAYDPGWGSSGWLPRDVTGEGRVDLLVANGLSTRLVCKEWRRNLSSGRYLRIGRDTTYLRSNC
jgi:hypothetical protein